MSLKIKWFTGSLRDSMYLYPTEKDVLYIVIDFGNFDVKVFILGHFAEERFFAHAVRHVTGSEWETKEFEYKNSPVLNGSAVFRLDDHQGGFIVGNQAFNRGGTQIMGAEKYIPEHMKPLLVCALMQVYAKSHPNVKLVITHPQSATFEQLQALYKSVEGKLGITLANGERIEWNIKGADMQPEARSAFNTLVLTNKGRAYKKMPIPTLKPGAKILLFDGGSYLSAFTEGEITDEGRLQINPNGSVPVKAGMNNVFDRLSEELRSGKIPQFAKSDSISQQVMIECVKTGTFTWKGTPIEDQMIIAEVERAVTASMPSFINPVQRVFTERYGGGGDYHAMAVSGGGGAGGYEYLMQLFQHPHIAPVEKNLNVMRFGAIKGAGKAKMVKLGLEGKLNPKFKKEAEMALAGEDD